MLNRPFVQFWSELQFSPSERLAEGLYPQSLCIKAADRISAIASAYHRCLTGFPCDTIFPIVLAAAIIYQFETAMDKQVGGRVAQQKLETCVRCLSTVEHGLSNARRYRERLVIGKSCTSQHAWGDLRIC